MSKDKQIKPGSTDTKSLNNLPITRPAESTGTGQQGGSQGSSGTSQGSGSTGSSTNTNDKK